MATYTLTDLDTEHLRIIRDALDLYGRIGMGQYREILTHQLPRPYDQTTKQQAEYLLDVVRRLTMPELSTPNTYHSIRSEKISDNFRVAYDIQQVLRHRLAWDQNPKGDFMVDFDEPWRTSTGVGMVSIQQNPAAEPKKSAPKKSAPKPVSKKVAKKTVTK